MRVLIIVALMLFARPTYAQEQVVTPTYTHESLCTQTVPCTVPCPAPTTETALPCTPPPVAAPAIHYEMRSKGLFWGGVGLVGAGVTLTIGSMTWARESLVTTYPAAPCGTDPVLTRLPIAPCHVSHPLLATGTSLAGAGVALMYFGGERVAVGADGRQIVVRVKF